MGGQSKSLQKFITVVPDEALQTEKVEKKGFDWGGMTKSFTGGKNLMDTAKSAVADGDWKTIAAVGVTVGVTAAAAAVLAPEIAVGAAGAALTTYGMSALYDAVRGMRSEGCDVKVLGESSVRELVFLPGHPRPKTVYAQHPANELIYFPISSFHRRVFENKFSEAIRLLAALGAREIQVEHKKGWDRAFAASLAAPIATQTGVAQVDASGGTSAKASENLLFTATLPGSDTPKVIDNPIWLPFEDTWQAIVEQRMEHGLKQFTLSVNYEDDYSVNASLKGKIDKAGLEIGGKFEDHVATQWTMQGTFGRTVG
ncbi:hypothetical protein ACFFJT_13085 [Dyella flava]|uniref:Uncharacterized protein n=1 Tax=Dyella flava TaxID=1920170 RepID=A0ABS2K261_9GAMM|nr:hypothetical protein [Dyella flava]MBM7124403.1 hypothetical protein [Dyella flava]GLQ52490.1 hypothetical protein GCM10010872_39390 [Dyella flava]